MTNTPVPTDAELLELADLCAIRDVLKNGLVHEAELLDFARAVLAKWGTPQPVVREPLTANQVSELANSAGYWHGDTSRADFINGIRYAEAAHGIKGGQHGTE